MKDGVKVLVLSRKREEKILIGDDIVLTIIEIRGDKCRIGISAPENVAIHRQEIWLKIQAENEVK